MVDVAPSQKSLITCSTWPPAAESAHSSPKTPAKTVFSPPPAPNINMFYQSIFTNACRCEAGVHPMVFVKTLCLNPICLFVALFPIWGSWQFFHTNHRLTPLVQRLHWNARLHLTFWQRSWFDQKIGGRNSPWQPRTLIFRGYMPRLVGMKTCIF